MDIRLDGPPLPDILEPLTDEQPSKRTQGPQWSNNSCWLDSSLEIIYHTLYPFLPFPVSTKSDSYGPTTVKLLNLLNARKEMELSSHVDLHAFRKCITQDKAQFRTHLYKQSYIEGAKSMEGCLVSVESMACGSVLLICNRVGFGMQW